MPTNPLPFGEILAGPMLALIQADTIAAQASAEFIENVGFVNGQAGDNFGAMRMITFTYQKQAIGEAPQTVTIQVPLLSLIPIPLLQVKDAQIDFGVEISDTQSSGLARSQLRTVGGDLLYLDGNRTAMSAILREQTDSRIQLKMKVTFAQADVPSGLARLFQVIDQSIVLATSSGNGNNSNTPSDTDNGSDANTPPTQLV
ncbi:MAG: DUF2589 domain-containing protein [Bacteroidia bacterium]